MPFKAVAYQEMLEKDGMPPEQSRAPARALETYVADEQVTRKDFASLKETLKKDLDAVARELRAEMLTMRQQLEAKIDGNRQQLEAKIDGLDSSTQRRVAELKFEMVRWMAGFSVGTVVTLLVAIWRFGRP